MTKTACVSITLALVACMPKLAFSQGFSGTLGLGEGKTVGVKQLLPAVVKLNQKRIEIKAESAIKAQNDELVTILRTKLVTMIQRDPRFIVDERNPQTILKFTVTNSYIDEKKYNVGTGSTTQTCDAFIGKLEVSYQALDAANAAPLDSENLVSSLASQDTKQSTGGRLSGLLRIGKGACGTDGKSSMHEARDFLVDGIVHEMGQRAAPSDQVITVKLPGKKLEPLSRLALAQRWGTLAEEAEKTQPLPKPEDDAYRIYLVALAKEAQAYDMAREAALRDQGKRPDITPEQADADFEKAQRLIDEARKLYKDAIQARPGEKEFLEPDTRMEKAIAVYATISRHKEEYQKFLAQQATEKTVTKTASASLPAKASGAKPSQVGTTSGSPLDQIVKFCQAGMDLAAITDYINDASFLEDAKASSYTFSFRTDPLTLTANCKEKASPIQRLMKSRLTPQRRAASSVHP